MEPWEKSKTEELMKKNARLLKIESIPEIHELFNENEVKDLNHLINIY